MVRLSLETTFSVQAVLIGSRKVSGECLAEHGQVDRAHRFRRGGAAAERIIYRSAIGITMKATITIKTINGPTENSHIHCECGVGGGP